MFRAFTAWPLLSEHEMSIPPPGFQDSRIHGVTGLLSSYLQNLPSLLQSSGEIITVLVTFPITMMKHLTGIVERSFILSQVFRDFCPWAFISLILCPWWGKTSYWKGYAKIKAVHSMVYRGSEAWRSQGKALYPQEIFQIIFFCLDLRTSQDITIVKGTATDHGAQNSWIVPIQVMIMVLHLLLPAHFNDGHSRHLYGLSLPFPCYFYSFHHLQWQQQQLTLRIFEFLVINVWTYLYLRAACRLFSSKSLKCQVNFASGH